MFTFWTGMDQLSPEIFKMISDRLDQRSLFQLGVTCSKFVEMVYVFCGFITTISTPPPDFSKFSGVKKISMKNTNIDLEDLESLNNLEYLRLDHCSDRFHVLPTLKEIVVINSSILFDDGNVNNLLDISPVLESFQMHQMYEKVDSDKLFSPGKIYENIKIFSITESTMTRKHLNQIPSVHSLGLGTVYPRIKFKHIPNSVKKMHLYHKGGSCICCWTNQMDENPIWEEILPNMEVMSLVMTGFFTALEEDPDIQPISHMDHAYETIRLFNNYAKTGAMPFDIYVLSVDENCKPIVAPKKMPLATYYIPVQI